MSATPTSPGALERVAVGEVRGLHTYLPKAVEVDGNQIEHLLVISKQESDIIEGGLVGEFAFATDAQVRADHEAQIRLDVDAHFASLGIVPSAEQVEAEVARRLQVLIDEAVAAYISGQLAADLDAALQPLLRLELPPDEFGRLQDGGLLELTAYDLIELRDPNPARFYYRDRYVPKEEKRPLPDTLADNLRNLPRYRSRPDGTREFL